MLAMFCRLYRLACRRYRKSGLTFSASAHLRAMQGKPRWRDLIDAVARIFRDHEHCATSFQRETASTKSSKGAARVNNEVAKETGKGLIAVVGTLWAAVSLNQMVALATLVYVVLQAAYLARKWWREEQEAK